MSKQILDDLKKNSSKRLKFAIFKKDSIDEQTDPR